MPSGLYARVQARGFASGVDAGDTGLGALESQGGPQDIAAHGQNTGNAMPIGTLTGFQPEGPPAPAVEILEGTWGLPGTAHDPDQTPGYGPGEFRSHAAPVMPGWVGSTRMSSDADLLATAQMHETSAEIHAADFGGPKLQDFTDFTEDPVDAWSSNNPGEAVGLAPLTGPQRILGGKDAVQGYDLRNRYGFDAGHRARQTRLNEQPMFYLDPAERPFIVPQQQGTFIPTDAVQGPEPWNSNLDAANVNPDDPSPYQPPPEPPTMTADLLAAPVSGYHGLPGSA